jgi:predicted unusual protein kinase regulating ubiquinone biosynthesis (AarF/ABC1/UbiB family)
MEARGGVTESVLRRDGLRDLFYGVYQRDSDKCLDALERMGVLVGGDRTSIKRTAEFFLKSFEDRLAEQRAEREADPDSQNSFKPQRSKEESQERRKAVCTALPLLHAPP